MKRFLICLLWTISASAFCQAPFGNYISIGPNGYLVNADSALAPGASQIPELALPVTVECFFKMSNLSQDHSAVFSFGPGISLDVSGGNGVKVSYLSVGGTHTINGFFPPGNDFLVWNHLVMEVYMESSSYYLSVGLNGDCVFRQEINSGWMNFCYNWPNMRCFAGHEFDPWLSYNQGFYGFIDELRYSSVRRYNLTWTGTGAYTVPSSQFTNDANTVVLLHFNEVPGVTVAQDNSGSNRDFLMRNDAFISGSAGIYTNNGFVSSDTVCYGEQIFVQGGNQITWSPSYGLSGNVWNPTITCDDTTITYTATIVDLNTGFSTTDNITLVIPPRPDLGLDISVCVGATALLQVDPTLMPMNWNTGATTTSILVQNPGIYAVETFGLGCTQTDTLFFSTFALLNFDLGNDTSICLNDTLYLNAGSAWSNITWWDATNDTTHLISMPGSYFAEVVDSNSCMYFDTVAVAGNFLLGIDLGNDTSLCYNESLFYNVGGVWSDINWWDGSHDSVNVVPPISGTYFLETTDPFFCQHFDTVIVVAHPLLSLGLGNDTSICYNDSILLNVGSSWSAVTWWDASTDTINYVTSSGNYFVETADGNSCYYYDTIAVAYNPVNINGFAFSSDSVPLIYTPVYFVLADTSNYIISLDSVITDATGFFSINTQLFDFSILVHPDSAFYPNQLPTYYDSSVTIQNSNFFNLNACDSVNLFIYSMYGINPGGPCFFGGSVVYGGRSNGDPVIGMKVIFVDSTDNILGYTYTNSLGYFYMDNLPAGDIRFWVDWPDIDNDLAPELLVTSSTNYTNVYFELYPDQLILLASSLEIDSELEEDVEVSIYPNPVTENISIQLPSGESGSLSIVNYLGASVLVQNVSGLSVIDLKDLSSGVYFFRIDIGDKQVIRKIVKI